MPSTKPKEDEDDVAEDTESEETDETEADEGAELEDDAPDDVSRSATYDDGRDAWVDDETGEAGSNGPAIEDPMAGGAEEQAAGQEDDGTGMVGLLEVDVEPPRESLDDVRDRLAPPAAESVPAEEPSPEDMPLAERVEYFRQRDDQLKDEIRRLQTDLSDLNGLLYGPTTDPQAAFRMVVQDQPNYRDGAQMAFHSAAKQVAAKDSFELLGLPAAKPVGEARDLKEDEAVGDRLYGGGYERPVPQDADTFRAKEALDDGLQAPGDLAAQCAGCGAGMSGPACQECGWEGQIGDEELADRQAQLHPEVDDASLSDPRLGRKKVVAALEACRATAERIEGRRLPNLRAAVLAVKTAATVSAADQRAQHAKAMLDRYVASHGLPPSSEAWKRLAEVADHKVPRDAFGPQG